MIFDLNGKACYNLQEQVAVNANDIYKIKLLIGKAYIEIDDTALTHTGTLTSDMKKILDDFEIVYVILKQADDLYQVFRTDYYESKFRKCAFFVSGSLHKLDLDYDNSTWSYSEQAIGGVQEQSNWTQTDTTAVDYIKNKPTIPAAQIQSDYTQTDNSKLDYIKNKPDLVEINPTVPSGTTPTEITGLKKGTSYYAPKDIEANPTVPTGTTPTMLQNLKVGSNYYATHTETLLYTNSNPFNTSGFTGTATFDVSNLVNEFDAIIIYYIDNIATSDRRLISEEIKVYSDSTFATLRCSEGCVDINGDQHWSRSGYSIVTTNNFTFWDCQDVNSGATDNTRLVPYKIIGIKYGK